MLNCHDFDRTVALRIDLQDVSLYIFFSIAGQFSDCRKVRSSVTLVLRILEIYPWT